MIDYSEFITYDPGKRCGRLCIRNSRISVGDVLGWLSRDRSYEDILDDFPELTASDIRACLACAADRENKTVRLQV